MRTLIAVTTCRARRSQADAQRATWAAGLSNVVFFVGGSGPPERPDEVVLNVDDSYRGLPAKVKGAMSWAGDRGYDAVLKLDDDVYLATSRLPFYDADYVGNFRVHNGNYPYDYASGFAYCLSAYAAKIIAEAPLTEDTFEDRWVGNTLGGRRGVRMLDEKRFYCAYPTGVEEAKFLWGSPVGKTVVAVGQYPASRFNDLHYWYQLVFEGKHCVSA